MVKDSGDRRQFSTGAVRDMAGKGRCDLIPWDVAEQLMLKHRTGQKAMFDHLYAATHTQDPAEILMLARLFVDLVYGPAEAETALLEVAHHYEDGAKKYSDRNWEKGLPVESFLDSAGRHLLKYLRGDTDERHDRAVVWNLLGALWTIKHRQEWTDEEEEDFIGLTD